MQGSNTTAIPTSDIQKNLGGLAVDNQYGPKTTAAVQSFQTSNGLKADGIFGPQTLAAYQTKFGGTNTNPTSNLITTSGSSRSDFVDNSSKLDAALKSYNATSVDPSTYSGPSAPNVDKPAILDDTTSGTEDDPVIKQLNSLSDKSNTSTQMLIDTIKSNREQQGAKLDAQYENYKSGLQLLGIQTNQAQVTPDLLASHVNQAESEHLDKLKTLDTDETKALMDAETAKDNEDFKTLNEKMTYVKQIQTEKTQALKDYNDALTTADDKAQKQGDAVSKVIAPDIYDNLQTLDDSDKEPFLVSIAQKFNIPLLSLSTALVNQKSIADKAQAKIDATGNKLLSPTEAATLGVPYGTTEAEAAQKGITPDRYKPTSTKTSSTQSEKEEIETGKSVLKTGTLPDGTKIGNAQGTDGYYDPGVYNTLFSAWKGTPKEFVAKYPIVGSVNPASYTKLPSALQSLLPKTATKKTGRSASGG